MGLRSRLLLASALVLSVTPAVQGQIPVNPSGHWTGTIQVPAPGAPLKVEIDLARNDKGQLAGTFSDPASGLKGLPLSSVAVEARSVRLVLRSGAGGGTFNGTVSDDGRTMSGKFTTSEGGHTLPFVLTRDGDARVAAVSAGPAVARDLVGGWTGTLDLGEREMRLIVTIANRADGRSEGTVVSPDGTGVEIPIAISQNGANVTIDVPSIGASFRGVMDAARPEVSGTWTQGSFALPLTLRRATPGSASEAPAHSSVVSSSLKELLDRWAAAAGGRDKIGAITSTYREATIEVRGFTGTIRVWRTPDGKYRKEEQIGPLSTVEVFDGTSGTVQQGAAPARPMSSAELARAKSTAFANANAVFFALFPERHRGTLTLEGDTIVLKPEGGIDWRVTLDPQTSLPKTMIHKEGEHTIAVTFAAYEIVDGVAFEKEIHRTTGETGFNAVIRFTKTVVNPPVDASLFSIGPK